MINHILTRIMSSWKLYRLRRRKTSQESRYIELRKSFRQHYQEIAEHPVDQHFITEFWKSIKNDLEPALFPEPPVNFFHIPWIRKTMVAPERQSWIIPELSYLKEHIPQDQLRSLLEEDIVGWPFLITPFSTSANTLHHAYHWTRFFKETRTKAENFSTIVEWGGGYGNAAKLFRKMHHHDHTYVIIDLPIFSCLQWLYLASILGTDAVMIHTAPGQPIRPGSINLVPLSLIDNVAVTADLFISTWALSESNDYAQDFVINKNWFGAQHLLLAYQQSNDSIPFGSRLGDLAGKAGAQIIPIPFVKRSSYAFR